MKIVGEVIREDDRREIKERAREGVLTKEQARLAHRMNDNTLAVWAEEALKKNPHVFRECVIEILTTEDRAKLGIGPDFKLNPGFPIEELLNRRYFHIYDDKDFWERLDAKAFQRYHEHRHDSWLRAPDGERTVQEARPASADPEDKPSIIEALKERISSFLYPAHTFAPDPSEPGYEAKKAVFDMWQEVKDPDFRKRVSKERLDLLEAMLEKGLAYRSVLEASLDDHRYLKERIVSVLTPENRARMGLNPDKEFSVKVGFPAEKMLARCLKAMSEDDAKALFDDLDQAIASFPNPRTPFFEFWQVVKDPAFRERVPEHRLEMLDAMVRLRRGNQDILDAALDDGDYLNQRVIEILIPESLPWHPEHHGDMRHRGRFEIGVFGYEFDREELAADYGAEKELTSLMQLRIGRNDWDEGQARGLIAKLAGTIRETPNPRRAAEHVPVRDPEAAEREASLSM